MECIMIKAVIFDLFGTLLQAFPEDRFAEAIGRVGRALGVGPDEMYRAWTEETYPGRHMGAYASFREEFLAICAPRGIAPTEAGLDQAIRIRYAFTRSALVPRPDALDTLAGVRSRGRSIGLISDCSLDVPELWPDTSLAAWFDTTVFSCCLKTRKPDPRMYTTVCKALAVLAADCIYVADGNSRELHGARSVGMRPFLLRVPSEPVPESADWEGHDWDGERISALHEILAIVDADAEDGLHQTANGTAQP